MASTQKIIIRYHRSFVKHALRYRAKRKLIERAITIFQNDLNDPRVKTHKLSGELTDYWSFSVNYHLRILFRFISRNSVLFLDIGSHEIYR